MLQAVETVLEHRRQLQHVRLWTPAGYHLRKERRHQKQQRCAGSKNAPCRSIHFLHIFLVGEQVVGHLFYSRHQLRG